MKRYNALFSIKALGSSPRSMILSIGAVKFNAETSVSNVSDSFHVGIEPMTLAVMQAYNFEIDPEILLNGWMNPNEMNKERIELSKLKKVDIVTALEGFKEWLGTGCTIWAHGLTNDCAILRNAYTRVLGEIPWSFDDERCSRTLSEVALSSNPWILSRFNEDHDALSTAISQAYHLQTCLLQLGLSL